MNSFAKEDEIKEEYLVTKKSTEYENTLTDTKINVKLKSTLLS